MVLVGFGLGLAFLLRVIDLNSFPLFFDEASHLRLSVTMIDSDAWIVYDPVGKYFSVWLVRLFIPYAQDLMARAFFLGREWDIVCRNGLAVRA